MFRPITRARRLGTGNAEYRGMKNKRANRRTSETLAAMANRETLNGRLDLAATLESGFELTRSNELRPVSTDPLSVIKFGDF